MGHLVFCEFGYHIALDYPTMPLMVTAIATSAVKIMPQKIALSDSSLVRAVVPRDILGYSYFIAASLADVVSKIGALGEGFPGDRMPIVGCAVKVSESSPRRPLNAAIAMPVPGGKKWTR